MRSDLHGTTPDEEVDRTVIKFDTGARGFRRAVWVLVGFAVALLVAGVVLVMQLYTGP